MKKNYFQSQNNLRAQWSLFYEFSKVNVMLLMSDKKLRKRFKAILQIEAPDNPNKEKVNI